MCVKKLFYFINLNALLWQCFVMKVFYKKDFVFIKVVYKPAQDRFRFTLRKAMVVLKTPGLSNSIFADRWIHF
jgi:hypothetical protein